MIYDLFRAFGIVVLVYSPIAFFLSSAEPLSGAPFLYQIIQRWLLGMVSILSTAQSILLIASDGFVRIAQNNGWINSEEADATGVTLPERHRANTDVRKKYMGVALRLASFIRNEMVTRSVTEADHAQEPSLFNAMAGMSSMLQLMTAAPSSSESSHNTNTDNVDSKVSEHTVLPVSPTLLEVPKILPRRRRRVSASQESTSAISDQSLPEDGLDNTGTNGT